MASSSKFAREGQMLASSTLNTVSDPKRVVQLNLGTNGVVVTVLVAVEVPLETVVAVLDCDVVAVLVIERLAVDVAEVLAVEVAEVLGVTKLHPGS